MGCSAETQRVIRTVGFVVSIIILYLLINLRTFPIPKFLVGVLTDMKIRSASRMAASMSFEKNRFLPRHSFTILSKPG